MSKASELVTKPHDWLGWYRIPGRCCGKPDEQEGTLGLVAGVNGQPHFIFTGGALMNSEQMLAFARWILDTFGEEKT